ncbi:hypothetical protein CEP54_012785 [Fusarium duplospermum]|uniref:Uncharacterized protein n=1 Tax=Fusarium duplospermum TaxID=1325734 RepID=A0A428P6M0_9HYPO|nr:hypothetical protein CEP54_012785 [Fusarium duplospermum]
MELPQFDRETELGLGHWASARREKNLQVEEAAAQDALDMDLAQAFDTVREGGMPRQGVDEATAEGATAAATVVVTGTVGVDDGEDDHHAEDTPAVPACLARAEVVVDDYSRDNTAEEEPQPDSEADDDAAVADEAANGVEAAAEGVVAVAALEELWPERGRRHPTC